MKRTIFATICAAAAALALSSCAGSLDLHSKSAVSPEGVGESDLPALRFGVYSAAQTKPGVIGYMAFDVLGGDLATKTLNPIDIYNGYMATLGTNVYNQWVGFYNLLYQTNVLLATAEKASSDQSVILGEAHYFRAFVYINLVTRWGGVPILRRNTMDKVRRDSVEDCWAFINEELEQAIDLLGTMDNVYLVSREAAMALAARAYLYQGNMEKAAEYAEAVIGTGKFSLEKDFSKIFGYERKADTETIFSLMMDDTEGGLNIGSQYFTYEYVNKGSGTYFPTQAFMDLFNSADKRKAVTLVKVGTDTCIGKYPGSQAHADPVIISRIAEMYLISAEAQGFPNGSERLNELRAARGLGASKASSAADFQDAILLERRMEFMGENLIWYDYIRMGKAQSALGITKRQLLWPIPEAEKRENDLLIQNPEW